MMWKLLLCVLLSVGLVEGLWNTWGQRRPWGWNRNRVWGNNRWGWGVRRPPVVARKPVYYRLTTTKATTTTTKPTTTTTKPTTTTTKGTTVSDKCKDAGKTERTLNNKLYSFSSIKLSFTDAQTCCSQMNMALVSISSASEQNLINAATNGISPNTEWWIGAFRLGPNWIWLNNEPFVYTNWITPTISTQKCALHIGLANRWLAVNSCTTTHRFICEKA